MKRHHLIEKRGLWLWALLVTVILGGCSRRVSRTYDGASLMGRYTLQIGEIRQEKGYVYNPASPEIEQDLLRLGAPRRFNEASPLWDDPRDVVRESLILQAEGTGLFKRVGMDLPAPDYVLSGSMQLFSTSSSDSLGMHMNYRAVLRAYLEDVRDGAMIWSGEGFGATPMLVEHPVDTSSFEDRETLAHYAPWLFGWSPDSISEAAGEVMREAAAAIVAREREKTQGMP